MACHCQKLFVLSLFFFLILAFAPGIPPHIPFTNNEIEFPLPLTGPLAHNNKLDDVEHMFKGYLHGPESIASRRPDEIFVGIHSGDLIKIFGKDFDSLLAVYHGKPCNLWEESKCGRPLGLRFAPSGKLIVADAYFGILQVDVDTGKKEVLVDSSVPIDGKRPLIPDDIDIDKEGNIYWSDASTNVHLDNGFLDLSSTPSGRLLKYDPKSKSSKVLMKDIHFANGVQLSPDETFVLVDECFRNRVLRYWLKGPKSGTSDVFAAGLPGMPDNLRARPEGGYYVSLVSSNQLSLKMFRILSGFSTLRKISARIFALVKLSIETLNSYVHSEMLHWISYKIFHLSTYASTSGHSYNTIVLDKDGHIIDSLQASSDKLSRISETVRVGNYLFFGSPYNEYLGRISLDNVKISKGVKKEDSPVKEEL